MEVLQQVRVSVRGSICRSVRIVGVRAVGGHHGGGGGGERCCHGRDGRDSGRDSWYSVGVVDAVR